MKNVADSWKMRRFTDNAKPRVQIAKVDAREERDARERVTLETQSMIAGKEFIRQNVKKVREIETQVKIAAENTQRM